MNSLGASSSGSDRKHILMLPAWWPTSESPTSGIFNRNLVALLRRRYDVSVIHIDFHDDRARGSSCEVVKEDGGFVVTSRPYRRFKSGALFPLLYVIAFLRAFRLLRRSNFKPDLIYARNILPCGLGAYVARKLYNIPYVTRESFSRFGDHMQSGAKRTASRLITRAASANSLVNEAQRREFGTYFPDVEFEIVGNVIGEAPFAPFPPPAISGGWRIIFAGSLVPIKGWDIALEALAHLTKEGPETKLRLSVAGGGEVEAFGSEVERLGLGDRVAYLGELPHEEVLRQIAEHHFLILPSRVDTCPNVVLEALSLGRPALVARCGGGEELIDEHNGLVVDPASPAAFAQGIAKMIESYARFDPARIRAKVIETNGIAVLEGFLDRYL